MGLLGRHLLLQLTGWVALAATCGAALFIASQLARVAPVFAGAGGRGAAVALAWLLIPVLGWALAPALLVAIFAVFGRMESDGELVALDASGVPRRRILAAPLALALALAGILGWIALEGGPACQRALRSLAFDLAGEALVGRARAGVFHLPAPGITLYSRTIEGSPAAGVSGRALELAGVFVEDARDPGKPLLLTARKAQLGFDPAAGVIVARMHEGTAFQGLGGGLEAFVEFDELTLRVDVLADLVDRLGFIPGPLAAPTRRLLGPPPPEVPAATWSYAFWRRVAAPFGLLALAAAALAIALSSRWRGRAAGVAAAAGLFLGYHLAGRLGEALAVDGTIAAWQAALAPSALVLIVACIVVASR